MPLHSQPIIIIIFINTDVYSPNLPSYSTVILSSFPSIPPSLHTDRYGYRVKKKKVCTTTPLTNNPIRHPLCSKSSHILQSCATHGEVTNQIPKQRDDLENGRKKRKDGGVELFIQSRESQLFVSAYHRLKMHRSFSTILKLTPTAKYKVSAIEPK